MGSCEMEAEQEGLTRPGISLDGLHRPLAEQVRHVTVALDRHFLFIKLAVDQAAGEAECEIAQRVRTMIEIVGSAREDAEEMVVAAPQRTEIRQEAEMPFADQRGAVARLLQ